MLLATETATLPFTVQWEDGFTTSYPKPVATKAEAFALLDSYYRTAIHPSSIRVAIRENGELVWLQHGTTVEVNA